MYVICRSGVFLKKKKLCLRSFEVVFHPLKSSCSFHVSFLTRVKMNSNWPATHVWVLKAQFIVEHWIANPEVMTEVV